jgi:hypothetical protein
MWTQWMASLIRIRSHTGGGTAKISQMLNQITMCLKIYIQD